MSAVLHPWGQTLTRHVHLHCPVPGGALSEQGRWHRVKSTYLFPVARALASGPRSLRQPPAPSRGSGSLRAHQGRRPDRCADGHRLGVVHSKPCFTDPVFGAAIPFDALGLEFSSRFAFDNPPRSEYNSPYTRSAAAAPDRLPGLA